MAPPTTAASARSGLIEGELLLPAPSGRKDPESMKNTKKWKLWSGLIALFLSGVLIGAVGSGIYLRHQIREFRAGGHPAVRHFILNRLTSELKLNDEQKTQVGKIVCRAQRELSQFRQEHRREIEEIFSRGMADMKPYLTVEQQRKLAAIYERTRHRRDTLSSGNETAPCD